MNDATPHHSPVGAPHHRMQTWNNTLPLLASSRPSVKVLRLYRVGKLSRKPRVDRPCAPVPLYQTSTSACASFQDFLTYEYFVRTDSADGRVGRWTGQADPHSKSLVFSNLSKVHGMVACLMSRPCVRCAETVKGKKRRRWLGSDAG